jgi:hypothetical protein
MSRSIFGALRAMHSAGRDDQDGQAEQEPPGRIHGIQAHLAEGLEPERAELVDVVRHRLVLLHDGADDGGDRDDHQQADRETHRRHQFDRFSQAAAAGLDFDSFGVHGF